jgi:hypothetical protein
VETRAKLHQRAGTPDNAAELMRLLATRFDPQNWSRFAPESFLDSSIVNETEAQRQRREAAQTAGNPSWEGDLKEVFAWSYNQNSTMRVENILGIKFQVKPEEIVLDYRLKQSLASRLWLVMQAGGLDVDRGQCTVKLRGRTIEIEADKSIRFTGSEGSPDWFGTTLNYLTPPVLKIWMARSINAGTGAALDALKKN